MISHLKRCRREIGEWNALDGLSIQTENTRRSRKRKSSLFPPIITSLASHVTASGRESKHDWVTVQWAPENTDQGQRIRHLDTNWRSAVKFDWFAQLVTPSIWMKQPVVTPLLTKRCCSRGHTIGNWVGSDGSYNSSVLIIWAGFWIYLLGKKLFHFLILYLLHFGQHLVSSCVVQRKRLRSTSKFD